MIGALSMSNETELAASLFEHAAQELTLAVEHCRTAARHFRVGEVPRAGAHAWAATGHIRNAEESLDRQAREHASKSTT
jgi:hypothetical protein